MIPFYLLFIISNSARLGMVRRLTVLGAFNTSWLGAFVLLFMVEVKMEQKKQQLIRQMHSVDNSLALGAVEQLRRQRWLTDGSLLGADLSQADLRMADLREADLRQVVLDGAQLRAADLFAADLRQAFLMVTDLRQAQLGYANLADAELRGAIIVGADLSFANLSRADLRHADLQDANLYGAILTYANLQGANLIGVNLHDAYLHGTDFTRSICRNTVFARVDLSSVIGLEKVRHQGPSVVGAETLFQTQGEIPTAFLEGAGVATPLIDQLQTAKQNGTIYSPCYIRFGHADETFALRLHQRLQRQGVRCWLDGRQAMCGDGMYEDADCATYFWDKVLLCCSKEALNSWWIDYMIEHTLQKERQLQQMQGKHTSILLPITLDNHIFETDRHKAQQLRTRLITNFTGWEKDVQLFETHVADIVAALRIQGERDERTDHTDAE